MNDTALCADIEPKFLLRAALRAALNKNFVPDVLAKRCKVFQVMKRGVGHHPYTGEPPLPPVYTCNRWLWQFTEENR